MERQRAREGRGNAVHPVQSALTVVFGGVFAALTVVAWSRLLLRR